MFRGLARAMAWFIDGLVDAWASLNGRLRRQQRLALVPRESGFELESGGRKTEREFLRIEPGDDGRYRFVPAALADRLKGRDVDLVLRTDEVLTRTLDPLPGESRQYMDSIVRHQLERLAPWRKEDVLYAYSVAPAERGNDHILVSVFATARSLHARALEALNAASPRDVRLSCPTSENLQDIAIEIDHGAALEARRAKLRLGVTAAVSVLGIAFLIGAGLLGWAWHRSDQELTALSRAVAEQRQKLVAAKTKEPATDQTLKAMVERRRITPFAVLAMEAISDALPDDTWLTDLRLSEGRVRITGTSQNVPALVPRIEAADGLAEATFFAPTTRLPRGEGDRFHLEIRLMPLAGEKQ